MPDTQQMHFISTIKATKDIAAGQEIFIRYGSMKWFEHRNIPRADVDYASTMWRPDLHPLPCRKSVAQTTGADGRHSFFVREALPSGTVLEVSLCLEVSVVVVDQFPFLWDFVLTGEMENEYRILVDCCQYTSASLRTHRLCFAEQDEANIGELAEQVLYFIYPLTLFRCANAIIQSPLDRARVRARV